MEVDYPRHVGVQEARIRAKFNSDKRIIAARKQYRADLKAGLPEREAWAKADAIMVAVRLEMGI